MARKRRSNISVEGDERVSRLLERSGVKALHLEPPMRRAAQYAESKIGKVPKDTGRLEASLHGGGEQLVDVDDRSFILGTTVYYARFVFHGTKHMRARPPRTNGKAVAAYAADEIGKHIRPGAL